MMNENGHSEGKQPLDKLDMLEYLLGRMDDPVGKLSPYREKQKQDLQYPKNALLANTLWEQYWQALTSYPDKIPRNSPLYYPFLYFYIRKQKNILYTISSFPYGSKYNSNILTQKTFPSFLVNVCRVSYADKGKAQNLYQSLYNLIARYPYDRIGSTLNELKKFSPRFVIELTHFVHLAVSSDKNIYYFRSGITRTLGDSDYQSIFKYPIPQNVPRNIIKHYFSAVLDKFYSDPSYQKNIKHLEKYETNGLENIFSNSVHRLLTVVRYDINSDSFVNRSLPDTMDCFNLKHTPLSKQKTIEFVPNGALSFLTAMCESDLQLIDQFSKFISQASSPTESNLTVLLSPKNVKLLKDALNQIFVSVPEDILENQRPLSLNLITKSKNQRALFVTQTNGASVAFISDVRPSESNLRKLRRILKGKPIALSTDYFPTQYYKNTLHFICLTSNQKNAKYLQDKLNANLIDFSNSETVPSNSLTLSDVDLHWLRTSFLLYGLKLRTCESLGVAVPSPLKQNVPAYPSFEESLNIFLQDYCKFEPGCFCNTEEVYERYTQYVATTQNGRAPLLKKRTFNKQLRLLLNKQKGYEKVVYKRKHNSRSSPSLWGYDGLKLPPVFPSLPQVPLPDKKELLREYLSAMSQYELHFRDILGATVIYLKN